MTLCPLIPTEFDQTFDQPCKLLESTETAGQYNFGDEGECCAPTPPPVATAESDGRSPLTTTDDTSEVAAVTARKKAERTAADILARVERIDATHVDEVLTLWKCSRNDGRRRLQDDPHEPIHSDTFGGARNSSVGTWHVSPITEQYPNVVRLISRWM